ncbi:MAG: hypothetical protein IJM59_13870 [Proteobacteria bacterium]|nr:hypothetical protein [Pseudomonadota bacterium]
MLCQLAVLYIIAACISVFEPNVFMIRNAPTIVLMIFSLALTRFFSDSIIEKHTRRYLVAIARLITLWIVLRGAKYIAFAETDIIARHLWYLYYIPMLFIPLLALFASQSVGLKDTVMPRYKRAITVGVTIILVILVLTNDLHQLVFRFHPGFADWDSDYTRAPVLYIVYGWIVLLFIDAIRILFSRCRVSTSRKLIWVPLLPIFFGLCYTVLYAANAWPRVNGALFGEFPEAVCFTMAGICLSLIYIGLIPSNGGYGRLFEQSELAAQIADQNLRVIYKSANAAPLTQEQLASPASLLLDRDTRLHRKAVTGGFVYWQDDIAALNRINEELQENGELLAEEAELLRLQNELKEERARIDAKVKVYDEIAAKVLTQSQKIIILCADAEKNPNQYISNMKTVCLLAVYIKRYANLALLTADLTTMNIQELALAIRESLHSLRDLDVQIDESLGGDFLITASNALSTYACFEQLLEAALPSLRGVQVSLADDELKLTIEGAELQLPDDANATITTEDDVSYIKIPLIKAGGCV